MGKEKTVQTTDTKAEQKVTERPEEKRLNQLQLQRAEQAQPGLLEADRQGLNLINQLLAGGSNLPGIFGQLSSGISQEAIANQATQLANRGAAGFQNLGILESGTAFRETAEDIANNLLFPVEQFNIGTKFNLLNQAFTGNSQVQSPIAVSSGQLGSSLAGLRSVSSTGSSVGTTKSMNPFLRSFQTSLGEGLGKASAGGIFNLGGGNGFFSGCWVASELFGGWNHPKTVSARHWMLFKAPRWFRNIYMKYGKQFAKFISDKPIIKKVLKPLFEYFAKKGGL